MNYQRVYDEFIADRALRQDALVLFERHHILPRCLRGGDEPENIIRLSLSDHLFAHVLLARIHGGPLISSLIRMSGMRKYRGGRRPRAAYAVLRERMRRDMLGNQRAAGTIHPAAGREVTRTKLRAYKRTPEHAAALKRAQQDSVLNGGPHFAGRTHTEATRALQREKSTGRVQSAETRAKKSRSLRDSAAFQAYNERRQNRGNQ